MHLLFLSKQEQFSVTSDVIRGHGFGVVHAEIAMQGREHSVANPRKTRDV